MYPRDLLSTANNQVGSSTTSSSSTGLQTLLGVVVGTLAVLLILLAVLLLLLLRCGEIETLLVLFLRMFAHRRQHTKSASAAALVPEEPEVRSDLLSCYLSKCICRQCQNIDDQGGLDGVRNLMDCLHV